MKICTRCKAFKDNCEFGKRASSKDGLDSRCRKCIAESSKESSNKNRQKNANGLIVTRKICPVCRLEKSSDCFGPNPSTKDGLRCQCYDCRNLKSRNRYEEDPDFRKSESIRSAKNYLNDRNRILNRTKEWTKINHEKKLAQRHKQIARKYGQFEFDLPIDFISILKEKQNNLCIYCEAERKLTIDHKFPLCRGGRHAMDNIVLCCQTCNSSKHKKTLQEWLEFNLLLLSSGVQSDTLKIICTNIEKIIKDK